MGKKGINPGQRSLPVGWKRTDDGKRVLGRSAVGGAAAATVAEGGWRRWVGVQGWIGQWSVGGMENVPFLLLLHGGGVPCVGAPACSPALQGSAHLFKIMLSLVAHAPLK